MNELASALRRFWRRPGRGAATALALAIGIGATTAAFAAFDGVLLRDLPFERQDELVVVWALNPERGSLQIPFRAPAYQAVVEGARSLEPVAGFSAWGAAPAVVEDPDAPYTLNRVPIAGDFFGVLGARPAAGRLLDATDDAVGAPPTAVLSHAAWQDRFAGDPAVVGTSLPLGDVTVTVVGVAPEGLDFPRGTDVWVPIRGDYADWPLEERPCCLELHLVGRLAGGAGAAAVTADLQAALEAGVEPGDTRIQPDLPLVVTSLEEHLVGAVRPLLRAGLIAALLLLLVAAANAALFLLAGGRTVAHELAVRRALGAERSRVLERLAADAAVVAALGTAGGLALAALALGTLLPLAPPELPRIDLVGIDFRAISFALAVAVGSAALISLSAGVALSGLDVRDVLAAGGRGGAGGDSRFRRGVAALQVCLAVVSAVGAGLLVRTVATMDRLDPGLAAEEIVSVGLRAPYDWMAVPERYLSALEQVVDDLESRPGIVAARPSLGLPLQQRLEVVTAAEGQSEQELRENPYVAIDAVLPGHFEALGIPLLRGRGITEADNRADAAPVVVVDEVLARALWPGEDPIGKRINGFGHFDTWFTVVGLARATRYREYLELHPRAYYPLRRLGNAPPAALLVRTAPDARPPVAELVREAFARADPAVRIMEVRPLDDTLRQPTLGRRFAADILGSFAAATLLLAVLGVYGVFTVAVQERTREMGVRRALGAQRASIVRLVLGGILKVAGAGALAGLGIALWAGSFVETLLYGVAATDPMTFAAVLAGSLLLAIGAGTLPALRASSVDPVISLRAD